MFLPKFLLLAFFVFSAQGFAQTTQCVDLSGNYQCSLTQTYAPFNLSFSQSINSDNVPIVTLKLVTPDKTLVAREYIADNKVHADHFTLCQKNSFSIVLDKNDGYFLTNTHYLTPTGDIEIVKHLVTIEMDEDGKASKMQIQQNLGNEMHCEKI